MRAPALVLIVLVLSTIPAPGVVIRVPDDHSTIQAAIDAASYGDTVIVAPGTYPERIDFKGKAITIQGSSDATDTVIDGQGLGSVVTALNGTGPARLNGFTITNGLSMLPKSFGGGIYCEGGTAPTLSNLIVEKNSADHGGGIYCLDTTLEIKGCILRDNFARSDGGGLSTHNATILLEDNRIHDNGSDGYGGGIRIQGGIVTVRENRICNNTAYRGGGVDMKAWALGKGLLERNEICGNRVVGITGGGGGVSATLTIVRENLIHSNYAEFLGGGVHCRVDAEVAGNVIRNNTVGSAHGEGAGIGCEKDSSSIIRDNLILDNSQGATGGGVYCDSFSTVSLMNNRIIGNSVSDLGGGIACQAFSDVIVVNNTIYGNSAARGGGVGCTGCSYTMDIANTILWKNQAPLGKEIASDSDLQAVLTIGTSDIENGLQSISTNLCTVKWGSNILDGDPCFLDPAGNDFHIAFDSICRDKGYPAAPGIPLLDFEGDPRTYGILPDIGADEIAPHIYVTGDRTPGGSCALHVTGIPQGLPVFLWMGTSVMDPPLATKYGDWYLTFPLLTTLDLGPLTIPSGVIELPFTVPAGMPVPMSLPLQALVEDALSNPEVMDIDA